MQEVLAQVEERSLVSLLPKFIKNHCKQHTSPYWGVWGRERYKWTQQQIDQKHLQERMQVTSFIRSSTDRLKVAFNFSFGICGLDGFAKPFTKEEFDHLTGIHQRAIDTFSFIDDEAIRFLLQELYCIRETASAIPGFDKGNNLVNESNKDEVLRKYEYLDFFKFSLINILIRFEHKQVARLTNLDITVVLMLAWFLGTGSLMEKIAALFNDEDWHTLEKLCDEILPAIEESTEFPTCDYDVLKDCIQKLSVFIEENRKDHDEEQMVTVIIRRREESVNSCNAYYSEYINLERQDSRKDIKPGKILEELIRLWASVKKNKNVPVEETKQELRRLRHALDKRYSASFPYQKFIHINDFHTVTNHPYFQGIRYEFQILSKLYSLEYPHVSFLHSVVTLFQEVGAFFAIRKSQEQQEVLFEFIHNPQTDNLPRLALAHHVHNANCETVHTMMEVNRLMRWPITKQVLNLSTSSSKLDVVDRERAICRLMGFNCYRIHARRHLKAGNQNRAVFNAIESSGTEYYMTMDDDYFIFPEAAQHVHEEIQERHLDHYQAPQALKELYEAGTTNAQRAGAETMHYFECTYGRSRSPILTFPRGTNTTFCFEDGVSSVADTGGFYVENPTEDFGQGYLSYFQENGASKSEKLRTRNPGIIGDKVFFVGEGVTFSGRVVQLIRWCHGGTNLFFHLFLPGLWHALTHGKTKVFSDPQTFRIFGLVMFSTMFQFTVLLAFCAPLVFLLMYNLGVDHNAFRNFEELNWLIVTYGALSACYSILQVQWIQGTMTLAPIRMMALDILTTTSVIWGTLKGLITGSSNTWHANKTKQVKLKVYMGPLVLLGINLCTFLMTYNRSEYWKMTSYCAGFNVVILVTGFIFLMHRPENSSMSVTRVPRKPARYLMIAIVAAIVLAGSVYLVFVYHKVINLPNQIFLLYATVCFLDYLVMLFFSGKYILEKQVKS